MKVYLFNSFFSIIISRLIRNILYWDDQITSEAKAAEYQFAFLFWTRGFIKLTQPLTLYKVQILPCSNMIRICGEEPLNMIPTELTHSQTQLSL